MKKNAVILVFLILFVGCNKAQPKILYVHASKSNDQQSIDLEICKAEGYRTAGAAPIYQPPPDCEKKGFECGYSNGATFHSNRRANTVWNNAFNTGVKACMYEKGYTPSKN